MEHFSVEVDGERDIAVKREALKKEIEELNMSEFRSRCKSAGLAVAKERKRQKICLKLSF